MIKSRLLSTSSPVLVAGGESRLLSSQHQPALPGKGLLPISAGPDGYARMAVRGRQINLVWPDGRRVRSDQLVAGVKVRIDEETGVVRPVEEVARGISR